MTTFEPKPGRPTIGTTRSTVPEQTPSPTPAAQTTPPPLSAPGAPPFQYVLPVATLPQVVRNVVLQVDLGLLRPVARRDTGVAYEPRSLLAILCYYYVRRVYGSVAIEDELRRDRGFVQLCHNEFPSPGVLRRFRRNNRDILHHTLVEVLKLSGLPAQTAVNGSEPVGESFAEEASRLITTAMFIDSIELDGDQPDFS